ncbi:hypothetical protein [Aureimonas mangrovi]|uniref:hypothetical protein n=1 Tax=Aureimonas mangrovi TaxID=2758041 RepID=UPI00163D582D|nr:hypothetical protein [Aureimonas mangrovi]
MRVVVIAPPEPIVVPADIRGDHAADDAFVVSMIAAATAEIDGPAGWLGRALGIQTLELQADAWPDPFWLPYPPEIDIVGIWYTDAAGVEHEWPIPEPMHRDRLPAVRGRMGDVRIRYRAGYGKWQGEGDARRLVNDPPANAKAAIILATGLLISMGSEDVFLQQEDVDGVGSTRRTVSPYISQAIERAVGNLLSPLRVFA